MIKRQKFTVIALRIVLGLVASVLLYSFLAINFETAREFETVTVYSYCDMLSSDDFEEFTKETGIEVVVRHFETIEEVMTKLMFTQDGAIDIVAPTDAMVEVLIQQKLLLPLERDKLPSREELDPLLMNRFYDKENAFTVPFSWTPIGIGYDTRVIKRPRHLIGWDLIFGSYNNGCVTPPCELYGGAVEKVCLGDDPLESIFLAMLHRYGTISQEITTEQENEIIAVLKKQKEWIECYTNNLRYFLISGVCPAIAIPSAYMIQLCEEYQWADFVIPSVGTVIFIGNLGISSRSRKAEKAYKVIEYLISRKGSLTCFDNHAFLPANREVYNQLPQAVRAHPYLFPRGKESQNFYTLHNAISLKKLQHMWHKVVI